MPAAAFFITFLVCIVGGFARTPLLGFGAYILVFYGHPPSRWWGALLPDLRWSFTAAICAVLAAYFYKPVSYVSNKPWHQDTIIRWVVIFIAWMWMQTPWVLGLDAHLEGVIIMTKYLLVMYVLVKILDSPQAMDFMFVAHIVGCAYLGVLARDMSVSGERLDGVGGPGIDDANTLGMMFATGAVLSAVQLLAGPLWKRGLVLLCTPFILNGLVLTQSRGAFLGLATGGFALFFLAPKGKRKVIGSMGAAGAVLFLVLASQTFWERMQTIQVEEGQEREKSAESRLVIAASQLRMFADHPMGVGHRGTAALSREYIPEEYLAKEAGVSEENRQRSSHNTFLTVLVEQGVIGAVIYFSLLVTVFRRLFVLRSLPGATEEQKRISMLAAGVGGALVAVLISGQFADYLRAEVLAWLYAMVVAMSRMMTTVRAHAK